MTLLVTLAVIVAKQERKLKELRGTAGNLAKLFINNCTTKPEHIPDGDGEEHLEQLTILMGERGCKGVITASGRTLLVESLKYSDAADKIPTLELAIKDGFKLKSGQPNIQFVKL